MKTLQEQIVLLTEQFYSLNYASPPEMRSFMQCFTTTITDLEQAYSRHEILQSIRHIRMQAADSPFIKRAQEWPRGYAGDYETINHILRGENKATPGTLGYHMENFFLRSGICKQHLNKVDRQAALVKQILEQNNSARILSIGCGTSDDLHQCLPLLIRSDARITLVDIDEKALEHSEKNLKGIRRRLTVVQGNIYKIIRQLENCFDLILIGGVFDYLKSKTVIVLLKELEKRLNKDGMLFFTNIANGNPYRISMEYLSDWILIERSLSDIEFLLQLAGIDHQYIIEKDSTDLTFLVTIRK